MHTHLVFLDESGDHSMQHIDIQFPVFALAGIIFESNYYYNVANPIIDGLKYKYWGHRNIIFHSVDIRKQKDVFSILRQKEVRESFLDDMTGMMNALDYKIIASGIHKADHMRQYTTPENPYNLTLEFIMERLFFYFKGSPSKCLLIAESRDDADNRRLYQVFSRLMRNGNGNVSAAEFQANITDLKFIPKVNNENGNQISDLAVYPIARKIISRARGYEPYHSIKTKFYSRLNGDFWGYGLKAFPGQTYVRIKAEAD
ncbi:DUF3800 domain-containing protein [Paenibacillus harenae]|uniref:DUF3800 domain-containing protein n=1 Tax=Paenibacillus harenae TaxID=306543 RepID=UPI002793A800|nr:DUF3800 domain-containing protein [Paenibacillus harenae]MDQ0062398.1 hypothetical protein [Paenibacillus harenae]